MNPLREHVAGASGVHAIGLPDDVGIVYVKFIGQQLQQVTGTTFLSVFGFLVGCLNGRAEELHLAPQIVFQRPAHEILDFLRPSVVVADVEHTTLQGYC